MTQRSALAGPLSPSLSSRLIELREQFDRSFARPLRSGDAATQNLLIIDSAGTRLAVRLSEVAGLHAFPKLTPLPSTRPALLGLVGVRGRLLCVYRLATLLELEHPARLPRWLLVCKADDQLALAIDSIDAYVHVPQSGLSPASSPATVLERFCPEILTLGAARPVLSLAALTSAIRKEAAPRPPTKEV
jgi:purine-binding chemotaxis protein CheW